MKLHKLLLLALACSWSSGAFAQWQWVDKDGRKVFSDRPPPQEISEKNILRQPHTGSPARQPADASSAAPPTATPLPGGLGKDKQLEENKAKAEAAEAAKKKTDAERQAKLRADNCAHARRAKAQLAEGQLVSHINAKGERSFMDDATRAAELRRADAAIASDCR